MRMYSNTTNVKVKFCFGIGAPPASYLIQIQPMLRLNLHAIVYRQYLLDKFKYNQC